MPHGERSANIVSGRNGKQRMSEMTGDHRVVAYFDKYFKWSIAEFCTFDGEMPLVKGSMNVPRCLVSYKEARKKYWRGAYVHFFLNDYQFDGERGIWLDTVRHVPLLEEYRGVLSPDFSLYRNMGRIPQAWNTYRNRLVQCQLERLGCDVISTVSWGTDETYGFCFKGLPKGKVVAVSTLGVMKLKESMATFEAGYREMCRVLQPVTVVVYGSVRGLDFGGTPFVRFESNTYNWTVRRTGIHGDGDNREEV